MEFQILKMYYEGTGTWFNIEPISDIHVGARFHDKKKLAEVVERIKNDPNRYTFIMGDIFDCTTADNKFYDNKTQDPDLPELEDQFNYILKTLLPIRNKILGVHCGNHDERQRKRHFDDVVLRLVRELNFEYPESSGIQKLERQIKYLKYLALTRLVFFRKFPSGEEHEDSSYDIFTAHGAYAGRRAGGNLNSNEDIARDFSADIYLTGHTHQIVLHKMEKISMDKYGHLQKIVKVFGVCGSFANPYNEGFITYPEYKILSASRVGTITISIDPYNKKVQAHE